MRIPLIIFLCAHGYLFGSSVDIDFTIEDGSASQIKLIASSGGESVDTLNYSGMIKARIAFDDRTLEVTSFTFLGGSIIASDTQLQITSDIHYDNVGEVRSELTLSTKNNVYLFETPVSPGWVNPNTQQLRDTDHLIKAISGTSTIKLSALGQTQEETIDFSIEPTEAIPRGNKTIFIKEIDKSLLSQTLQIDLRILIQEDETERLAGTRTDLTLEEFGVISSSFTLVVPTELKNWSDRNEVTIETGDEKNRFGVPYMLLFALDLPSDTPRDSIPIEVKIRAPRIEIQAPEQGLLANLSIHVSHDLSNDSWEYYPIRDYMLKIGGKGSRVGAPIDIPLVGPYPMFFRVFVTP